MGHIFVKDPQAVLDYAIDWTTWLDGDTIATSTWVVPSGITKDSDANTTTQTSIWLSAGSAAFNYRRTYALTNQIVTPAGRTTDQTIYIQMRDK